MPFRPLDGSSHHLQIQKEGCGRARGLPALRKLGQSRLVTSLLMEAASSVWIFLYCRQQCRETSWFLCISMLIIWAEISLYLPRKGPRVSAPPPLGAGLFPPRPLVPFSICPMPHSQPHTWTAFLILPLNLNLVRQALKHSCLLVAEATLNKGNLGPVPKEKRRATDCLSSSLPLPLTC